VDGSAARTVSTTCRICASECGINLTVVGNRIERIAPDKENPHTWRDFCAKGRTAHELLDHPRRLLAPLRREGDAYREATWDEAIGSIAHQLREIIADHGPDAVAFYWGNPAGFAAWTVPFVVGLMDAIGTHSRYYVGSVDQGNYHLVAEEMLGSPIISLVPDVDQCDCFLLVGMNPAVSGFHWVWCVPDGWRRTLEAQRRGARLIVVDPMRTATAAHADVHVAIRPGEDWAFLLAVLKVILHEGLEKVDADLTTGLDDLRALVAKAELAELSARCDVEVSVIEQVAREFASARTAMCVANTGVSQTRNGTLGEWLSHVLNFVTDRSDRPGGRRYERGHVDVAKLWSRMARPSVTRSRVRDQPSVGGYRALAELPDEITVPGPGQVRAMITVAGNPVISGPNGPALDAALASLDLVVAVDLVQRESHRHAHWLLPTAHWLERTDSHPFVAQIQDQPYAHPGARAVDPPPGVREDWEVFADLALALRVPLFGIRGVNTFVGITRRLARMLRRPSIAFNPRWAERALVRHGRRLRWKDIQDHPHGWVYGEREYGNLGAALGTADKRVRLAPPTFLSEVRYQLGALRALPVPTRPLLLINQRRDDSMNSWLNDLPGLRRRRSSNCVEISRVDAAELGIATGDQVTVESAHGSIQLAALVSQGPKPGVVVIEHGWGSGTFDPVGSGPVERLGANRNALVGGEDIDALSQVSVLNGVPVRVVRTEPVDSM
jgi:formate dehydrogenase